MGNLKELMVSTCFKYLRPKTLYVYSNVTLLVANVIQVYYILSFVSRHSGKKISSCLDMYSHDLFRLGSFAFDVALLKQMPTGTKQANKVNLQNHILV